MQTLYNWFPSNVPGRCFRNVKDTNNFRNLVVSRRSRCPLIHARGVPNENSLTRWRTSARETCSTERFTISDSRLETFHDSWNRVDNFTHFWTVHFWTLLHFLLMSIYEESVTKRNDASRFWSYKIQVKWSFIKKKEKNCWRNWRKPTIIKSNRKLLRSWLR